MDKETLAYYDRHAEVYSSQTRNADMRHIQDRFLSYLCKGNRILDLGCGTGRDSCYFLARGFAVEAVDGSSEMVSIARENTGLDVRHMYFEDMSYRDRFDGIWACASLLHTPSGNLPSMLLSCFRALGKDGILYLSFKEGTFEGMREGRYYTDMTEERLRSMLCDLACGNSLEEMFVSKDAIAGRNVLWLNAIARKL